jgi:hypothetical protein
MHSADDGSAQLDRDDQDGFGPETITVLETHLARVYQVLYNQLYEPDERFLTRIVELWRGSPGV